MVSGFLYLDGIGEVHYQIYETDNVDVNNMRPNYAAHQQYCVIMSN